ncbi:hypothetical protein [Cupriavidus agavae]|uniref:Uncharacterized protein n=1 Tax=Cupriavidus agavae TaxID=1001822 RepID=A0A4Q7RTG7_9BURK|nr:hypothetical protein [Cupriavidus agavae]RZT36308.1 hypothetical protein EV147_3627 [Cupriavidus agavae]
MKMACSMAVAGAVLTGCTVITVEGNNNQIRDAGGHGGLALPDVPPAGAGRHPGRERLERLERLEHRHPGRAPPEAPAGAR